MLYKKFFPAWTAGIIILSLSLGSSLSLAAPTGQEILNGLSERYKGLTALEAAYSRTTQTPMSQGVFKTSTSQTAGGHLSWQKPAALRLDQNRPTQELMVTDGSTVWWYLPAEKQVHVYRKLNLAGEMAPLLSFLTNLSELKKSFKIKKSPEEPDRPGQMGLILEPKKKDSLTGQIAAFCDRNFQLTGFALIAVTGERTDFYLTEVQTASPPAGTFVFEVPRGVKIIEETDQ